MRQLLFGAYTVISAIGAIMLAAQHEFAFALVMLACAGVGAVGLTKGERY